MVHIYNIEGGDLVETRTLKHSGSITCVGYSPDGAYLAAGDGNRRVILYSCPDYEVCCQTAFSYIVVLY